MMRRPCILMVGDDQEMLRILSWTLEMEGFGVAMAADDSSGRTQAGLDYHGYYYAQA